MSDNDLCFSSKCIFIKYFQMVGLVLGQIGQCIGTLEQGDDAVDSAAVV